MKSVKFWTLAVKKDPPFFHIPFLVEGVEVGAGLAELANLEGVEQGLLLGNTGQEVVPDKRPLVDPFKRAHVDPFEDAQKDSSRNPSASQHLDAHAHALKVAHERDNPDLIPSIGF